MKRYIHGAKNGIYIIDLNKTLSQLELAKTFINDVVLRGDKILFVGTKKQARDIFKNTAEELEQPYVIHRWLGHDPRFRPNLLAAEHVRHHGEGNYFAPSSNWVFGTYRPAGTIRVAAKLQMAWLADPGTGRVRAAYAEHYDIVD